MFNLKHAFVALAVLAASNGVMAGAGARVNACVNYQTPPIQPFTVNFTPVNSQTKCMNSNGSPTSVTVTSSGLTCGSIGYVESKTSSSGGDFCATADHRWFLTYTTSGGATNQTGTLKSEWYYSLLSDNKIELDIYPENTQLCGSKSMCHNTRLKWYSGVGTAYFIFQPDREQFGGVAQEVWQVISHPHD